MYLFLVIYSNLYFAVVDSAFNTDCSKSTLQFDYTGHINLTVSGKTCQAWNSQFPHAHSNNNSLRFPDDSLQDASNYCRNPDGELGGAWCYTTDPDVRWDYCDVPSCSVFPECRLTDVGIEYQGQISTTSSGASCIFWSTVDKYAHSGLREDANYCRNPDNKPQGPWCYTDADNNWEYCDVPFCKPSAYCKNTKKGQEYAGTVSVTENGVPCQRWDSQYPHPHEFGDNLGKEAANYCRNPNGLLGPWCYTLDPSIEWEYCDIPDCIDCKISDTGVEYSGTRDVTETLKLCLPWNTLSEHATALQNPDRFPDATLDDAVNYCRNPDRKAGGPWCFYGDSQSQWEYCDIPSCTGKEGNTFKPRLANHILHIGIDGLHPCFVNCSSGAPNILNRIAAAGTYTLSRGRTELQTWSAPSWTAILCSLPAESSGTTDNSWRPPWMGWSQPITPSMGSDVPFPCAWQQIKGQDASIRTATFTNWDWFWYITSYGMPPSALDYDFFCDDYSTCDEQLVLAATDYINGTFRSSESSYTFVYIGNVDGTGHTFTWCNPRYLAAVDEADRLVGILMDAVDEAELANPNVKVTVLLSTDHGGHNFGHGSWQDSDLVIPAFVRGPRSTSTSGGRQLRHDISNVDYVPTAAEWLGLKPSPWWKGKVIWESFEQNETSN